MKRIRRKILREYGKHNKETYWNGRILAGDLAKKLGVPVGTIGCPHCGWTSGINIEAPICIVCGKPYWQKHEYCMCGNKSGQVMVDMSKDEPDTATCSDCGKKLYYY